MHHCHQDQNPPVNCTSTCDNVMTCPHNDHNDPNDPNNLTMWQCEEGMTQTAGARVNVSLEPQGMFFFCLLCLLIPPLSSMSMAQMMHSDILFGPMVCVFFFFLCFLFILFHYWLPPCQTTRNWPNTNNTANSPQPPVTMSVNMWHPKWAQTNRASIVWARYFFQFNFMFCSLILTLSLRILWGGFV